MKLLLVVRYAFLNPFHSRPYFLYVQFKLKQKNNEDAAQERKTLKKKPESRHRYRSGYHPSRGKGCTVGESLPTRASTFVTYSNLITISF